MPTNQTPPVKPEAPAIRWFRNEKEIPPPPPPLSKEVLAHIHSMGKKRREQEAIKLAESRSLKGRLLLIRNWIILIAGIALFSWALTLGMQKQAEDVSTWAKGFDYRHCWGKFDTPACHERKAAGNKAAYEKYTEGKK